MPLPWDECWIWWQAMAEILHSVGLDVGTTTSQMVFSQLTVENLASGFSVPELQIVSRRILYQSPVHFTPLLRDELVDGDALRRMVDAEYAKAGIRRDQVDTGAVIITGETSRKENAAQVLQYLSDLAGDFVVTTAGPDLESILAAKGAGAVEYSAQTGQRVLHMDIGGGTSNLAWIENGRILATGCLNVGGRLVKLDKNGVLTYISPVLQGIFQGKVGDTPSPAQLEALAQRLASALEMAAGLRERTALWDQLWTKEAAQTSSQLYGEETPVLSFSGGVADCIQEDHPSLAFGDLGPLLGQAIRHSKLCQGQYTLGRETIRATVIGAGCHSTQLTGSTVFHRHITFPLRDLPVVTDLYALSRLDGPGVLAIPGPTAAHYAQIAQLADELAANWPAGPVCIALEADVAKALGHALALRLPPQRPILCIDRVRLREEDYLDVGTPLSTAIPVVVKTLILNR